MCLERPSPSRSLLPQLWVCQDTQHVFVRGEGWRWDVNKSWQRRQTEPGLAIWNLRWPSGMLHASPNCPAGGFSASATPTVGREPSPLLAGTQIVSYWSEREEWAQICSSGPAGHGESLAATKAADKRLSEQGLMGRQAQLRAEARRPYHLREGPHSSRATAESLSRHVSGFG